MDFIEFESFLHHQIPITKAMDFKVKEFTPSRVSISAGLESNVNHKLTAFGGSINSLVTVCGWSMVYIHIKPIDPEAHIVIQKSTIEYLSPIRHDFHTVCEMPGEEEMKKFIDMYQKFGRARIKLTVCCFDEGRLAAKYEGQYVAFK